MRHLALLGGLLLTAALASAKAPNVVVLLADDAGWGDYSFNGNRQFWSAGNKANNFYDTYNFI